MRERIAKESTIKTMQTILTHVVSQGLGKKAGSSSFKVAGKTGTAQISQGAGGYKSGVTNYLLSFCGFFPADQPRYTCIVCLQKAGLPASGGGMCGPVFRNIAEGIMAQDLKVLVTDAKDSSSVFLPDVKYGNVTAAHTVLSKLGFKTTENSDSQQDNTIWGSTNQEKNTLKIQKEKVHNKPYIPKVIGMGARDAVYMLEARGVRVKLNGRGKVVEQRLPAGHKIAKGDVCILRLN